MRDNSYSTYMQFQIQDQLSSISLIDLLGIYYHIALEH